MTWAIWQPVTKAKDDRAGRPRSSSTQRPATASRAEVAGVGSASPVFWSQAETSQSAASGQRATSNEPEPASGADRHEARLGRLGELLDDGERVGGLLRKRAVEELEHLPVASLGPDRARVERLEVVGRELGCPR